MKKLKLSKMNNKEKIQSLLKQIEDEFTLHIKECNFYDGYFVFPLGKNAVCNFEIKEIPGFIFGIWVEKDINPNAFCNVKADDEIIFFTQYKRDFDKFKPSASGFVTGSKRNIWEEQPNGGELIIKEEWDLYTIGNILKFMQKHPIKAYYYSWIETPFIWDEQHSDIKILYSFIHSWIYHWKSKIKEKRKLKHLIKCTVKFAKKNKSYFCNLRDFGENYSPRLDIELRQKPNIDENSKQFIKDDNAVEQFEKKWWKDISINYFQHPDNRKDKRLKRLFKTHLNTTDDVRLIYCNYNEETIL